MRDDERYPISATPDPIIPWENVDSRSSLPQVSVPKFQASHRDKYLVHPYETVERGSSVREAGRRPPTRGPEKPRKDLILGLRKRVFWCMAAVITTLMIVGIVVGAVIGSSTTGSSGESSSATTNSPSFMSANSRQIGAATLNGTGSTSTNVQVVYQDLGTTDLLYRLIWDDMAGSEQRISSLDPPPQRATPIAVTTANTTANDGIMTNLFYLSVNQENSSFSHICQATLQCSLGAESCSVSTSGIISNATVNGVVSSSGLAAAVLPGSSGLRVYYKSGNHGIRVLSNNGTTTNDWEDSRIGSLSYVGSGISVNYDQKENGLQVIFVDSDSLEFEEFDYNDAAGIGTSTAYLVTSSAPSGWQPTAEFSTCFQPSLNQHHIFYVDSTGDIHGIFRGHASGNWTLTQPPGTGTPVGGIASVAWDSQVRLLYMTDDSGTLSMSTNNNSEWSNVQAL